MDFNDNDIPRKSHTDSLGGRPSNSSDSKFTPASANQLLKIKGRERMNRASSLSSGSVMQVDNNDINLDSGNNEANSSAVNNSEEGFKCIFCNMRFAKLTALKSHELVHTGEKNHACIICGKAFTRRFLILIDMTC